MGYVFQEYRHFYPKAINFSKEKLETKKTEGQMCSYPVVGKLARNFPRLNNFPELVIQFLPPGVWRNAELIFALSRRTLPRLPHTASHHQHTHSHTHTHTPLDVHVKLLSSNLFGIRI